MTQTTAWDTTFQPTPGMVKRHSDNVSRMIESARIEGGSEVAERVERAWASIASQPWMSIEHALACLVERGDAQPGVASRSDLLAVRTQSSLSAGDLLDAVARVMGITPARAREYLPDGRHSRDLGGETFLYRYFDSAGELLYVGVTHDIAQREAWHRSNSRWFSEHASRTVETYPTRNDALAAESEAIRAERPAFNRQGAPNLT